MNAEDLNDAMHELFNEILGVAIGQIPEGEVAVPEAFADLIRVESFEESGVLSNDPGLVLRFKGGAEFQLTPIRSR